MLVRCGRCKAELEIAGPGEFLCPACGSRNVVRGAGMPAADPFPPASPFEGLGSAPPTGPPAPEPEVRWIQCPKCSYRFVVGEVDEVACPTCSSQLDLRDDDVKLT